MRFICDTNELNTALSIVSRALAVRSTKPILEGILFESCDEGLRLTCTDLALGIETLLPATFSEEGRAVLPGKLLCEIIRKRPVRHRHRRADAGDDPLRERAHHDQRL